MKYQQAIVAHVDELKDGQMKKANVGDTPVLLARIDGKYYAVGAHCTHYGGPLAEGALNGSRVTCPWHHACFDVRTGRHLEAPGLDGLPSFPVEVEGADIIVKVPDTAVDRIPNEMAEPNPDDQRVFAIIGGGAAGAYAAEGMREAGYRGRILLISREDEVPYDRPNVSKEYLTGKAPEEWMPLRPPEFYKKHGIELMRNYTVTRLDTANKRIHFSDDTAIDYDKVLICSGGNPRTLNVPNADLGNIFTLRSISDSRMLRELGFEFNHAVVIGASFIGLEGAAAMKQLGCTVDVVAPEDVPFEGVFGKRVGQLLQQVHEDAGIKFHLGTKVLEFEGDKAVTNVFLENRKILETDVVLLGIGVQPNTGFIEGIDLESDGSIRTNAHLHAGNDVYAAGDIAFFPYRGHHTRIEHWQVACNQGRIAGMNMAGAEKPFDSVPFFWSHQHEAGLAYVGHARRWDDIHYEGNVEDYNFLAFYLLDGEVQAVLGMGRDQELAAIHELMRDGHMPHAGELKREKIDWLERLYQHQ